MLSKDFSYGTDDQDEEDELEISSRNLSSTSTKGKGVTTNSATFAPTSTYQVSVHDDDEIEEDIGEDGDGLDGDAYFEDDGDLE
ncbi:hypothetical protein V6N11_012693 [Hibiscus sabdariffa]|uniref:Uncharacterized protein n=1 Tax=Hibiscus sabdariffa TaxID=183260 RepID=A0ABR2QC98_9ROSI